MEYFDKTDRDKQIEEHKKELKAAFGNEKYLRPDEFFERVHAYRKGTLLNNKENLNVSNETEEGARNKLITKSEQNENSQTKPRKREAKAESKNEKR